MDVVSENWELIAQLGTSHRLFRLNVQLVTQIADTYYGSMLIGSSEIDQIILALQSPPTAANLLFVLRSLSVMCQRNRLATIFIEKEGFKALVSLLVDCLAEEVLDQHVIAGVQASEHAMKSCPAHRRTLSTDVMPLLDAYYQCVNSALYSLSPTGSAAAVGATSTSTGGLGERRRFVGSVASLI